LSTVAALLEGLRVRACSPQTLTAGLHELAGAAAGDLSLRHRQPLRGTCEPLHAGPYDGAGSKLRGALSVWRTGGV